MTSELPRRVSVKDLAREIEARRLESTETANTDAASGGPCGRKKSSSIPAGSEGSKSDLILPGSCENKVLKDGGQRQPLLDIECPTSPTRRNSEGDIFQRCRLRKSGKSSEASPPLPPKVPLRRRSTNSDNEQLPTRLDRSRVELAKSRPGPLLRKVAEEDEQGSGSAETEVRPSTASGLSKSVSFKSGSPTWVEGTILPPQPLLSTPYTSRDVGAAIFSNRCCNLAPAPFHNCILSGTPVPKEATNPLEEIIASLERICDQFDETSTTITCDVDNKRNETPTGNERSENQRLESSDGISDLSFATSIINGEEEEGIQPSVDLKRCVTDPTYDQVLNNDVCEHVRDYNTSAFGAEGCLDLSSTATDEGESQEGSAHDDDPGVGDANCNKILSSKDSHVYVSFATVHLSKSDHINTVKDCSFATPDNIGDTPRDKFDPTSPLTTKPAQYLDCDLQKAQLAEHPSAYELCVTEQERSSLSISNNNDSSDISKNSLIHNPVSKVTSFQSDINSSDEKTEAYSGNDPPTEVTSSYKRNDLENICTNKPRVRQKPDLPTYVSLSRKSLIDSSFASEIVCKEQRSGSLGGESTLPTKAAFSIEEAKSILAGLDFAKYKRRKNDQVALPDALNLDRKADIMASTNKAMRPRSPKSSNAKLKDLLELLKPNTESSKSRKKNFPICRSSSFSNAEVVEDMGTFYLEEEEDDDNDKQKNSVLSSPLHNDTRKAEESEICKVATLPKRKKPSHRPLKACTSPLVPAVHSCPSISKLDTESCCKPEPDEGLVSDSEAGSGAYVRAYVSCVTSPPLPKRSVIRRVGGHVRSASDDVTSAQALLIADQDDKPGSSLELSSGSGAIAPDKRKRRKGISSMTCGQSVSHHGQEPAKSGTGRSLTYPPQRKTSVPEEAQAYSSVDSNGLKSLKKLSAGLLDPSLDEHHLLSDLSLADSHLCPSEGTVEDTYQDVVDSVMRSPDYQHLSVEDRNMTGNGKLPKKKHHSDPGGDVSSGVSGENVVFMPDMMIGSSRSEPHLGTNDTVITSSSSSLSTSSGQHPLSSHYNEEESGSQSRLSTDLQAENDTGRVLAHGTRHVRVGSAGSNRFQFDADTDRHRLGTEFNSSKSPQEQRRYSKRRLRGPYGEMLEEEMRKSGEKQKPNFNDLSFLQEICETTKGKRSSGADTAPVATSRPSIFSSSQSLDDGTSIKSDDAVTTTPKRKISANYPLLDNCSADADATAVKRSTSSCSRDSQNSGSGSERKSVISREKDITHTSPNGLTEIPKMAEKIADTRTHVVGELYDTEKSYVESLQILVNKYMKPLKSPDYSGIVDTGLVDEIFFQIPEILAHHEIFLEDLRVRLSTWDSKQKVGDVFVEAFTKQHVIDTYTAFINNWKSAKDAIKIASQAKPGFARFLEHMTREHKGKLTLDALLIMPVQRIPRYELLIKELLKHTHVDHPDHRLLVAAQREVHELALKINRMEREAFQHEQMQQKVKDIEQLIDGVVDLVQPDRGFIRHDMVHMPGGLGTKKERCLFLFTDLLIITSMKRKSGTMRKPSSTASGSPNSYNSLEMNKYKLLTKFSLDNLDITRSADNNFRRLLKDIENLEEDFALLNQIGELASNINSQHQGLDEAVKELMCNVTKQLGDKQNADSQLVSLEMTVTIQEGVESLTILFSSPEKRAAWEAAFNDAKQKLALSTDRRPPPEFMHPLPIRKTRAGLQFTCAAATLGLNQQGLRDVWVCNSDGYVGQVCVLSLQPEPTVMSCNGVCNARILTIASIPAAAATTYPEKLRWRPTMPDNLTGVSIEVEECDEEYEEQRTNNGNIQLDSDSSDDDDESESPDDEKPREEGRKTRAGSIPREDGYDDMDHKQPTMWLGTEDGCIHVYNCNDNIRTKKNKIKIQHMAAIHCIIYLDNRVFVALANGEVHIYKKDPSGGWSNSEPQKVQVGSVTSPVTKMLAVAGKLWCGCQNNIKVVNTLTLQTEHSFSVSNDSTRVVLCMVTSGLGVWAALQHSAVLRLFHATSYECLLDVNVAPAVTKMLAGCDDIIRQHKAACLRVTAVLACKDLLWVGTSAGVVLTLPLPHLTSSTTKLDSTPNVAGLPHGHTGHVRFLTCVEMGPGIVSADGKVSRVLRNKEACVSGRRASTATSAGCKLLVISGGDGYEDFRNCGLGEAAGRDDSTNHLLLWQV